MRRTLIAVATTLVALAGLLIAVQAPASAPPAQTTLWAVVNLDGSLARGSGAVSSAQLGVDGQYQVVFNRNVATCAYAATGGEATATAPDDAIVLTVAPREGNTSAVFVQEYDAILGFDSYSSGFHLHVLC